MAFVLVFVLFGTYNFDIQGFLQIVKNENDLSAEGRVFKSIILKANVMDTVEVSNLLASFCRVFEKDTLRHFFNLEVLARKYTFQSYIRVKTRKTNKKCQLDINILVTSKQVSVFA